MCVLILINGLRCSGHLSFQELSRAFRVTGFDRQISELAQHCDCDTGPFTSSFTKSRFSRSSTSITSTTRFTISSTSRFSYIYIYIYIYVRVCVYESSTTHQRLQQRYVSGSACSQSCCSRMFMSCLQPGRCMDL